MNETSFQTNLIQRLFDTQLYALQKAKSLKGSVEAQRWLNLAHETNYLIKSTINGFKF